MVVLVEPNAVEYEKLDLGSPVADVGYPAGLQILLGFLGNISRVSAVGLARDGVEDVTDKADRGVFGERVHHGGVGVGEQDHVGFVDRLKSPDARAVKPQPLLEYLRR